MLWQIIVVALLFLLILFIPVLPNHPIPAIQLSLGIARAAICFSVFFIYTLFFVRKTSRFSMLMALAFLLLMLGNTVILPQYLAGNMPALNFSGNLLRTGGFLALFSTFWIK